LERYNDLKNRYEELNSDYRALESQNEELRREYNSLYKNYTRLYNFSKTGVYPPYVVAENRTFTAAFKGLDGETYRYVWVGESLEKQVQRGFFMRELTASQAKYLEFWGSLGFEGPTKYQRLGDFGNYYQLNPFVVPTNFGSPPLAEDIYYRYSTDEERVKEVYNYVTQVNAYNKELKETPRFPLETLLFGGGDCEDTAILAASMLEAMPEDWDVQFVLMDANNPTDPQEINHVLIYIDTGEYQTFMETTHNREPTDPVSLSPYDEVNG